MSEDNDRDDKGDMELVRDVEHMEWGFLVGDCFFELPKLPMIRAGMLNPPFDVTLPSGSVRRIISRHRQEAASDV